MKIANFNKGFTLLEMAIVLVIVGLFVGGLFIPLSNQKEVNNLIETREKIAVIKEAVLGFAIVYGRLPCPADETIKSSATGAGVEQVDGGVCKDSKVYGAVPWVTLGVPETDAWGRRFSYRVSKSFSDDFSISKTVSPPSTCTDAPERSSFALCSEGDINVSDLSGASSVLVASKLPVIIVSHGKNGYGAYTTEGLQFEIDKISALESNNINNDASFTSMAHTPSFDDIVDWLSPNILFNRMVAAGKLP